MNTGKSSKWFPHDSDALDDPKIILLTLQLGMEGYGLYWMLIEYLIKQPEYSLPIALIEALSRRFQVSKEKLETIVMKYDLFEVYDNYFFSPSLSRRMQNYDSKSEVNKRNALKRWQCDGNATALPPQSDRNAIRIDKIRIEEKREDKKKEDRNCVPPSFEMVSDYCKERNNTINPQAFIDFYSSNGWMVGKSKMKDWQAAIRTWESRGSSGSRASPTYEDPVQKNIQRIAEAERQMKLNKQRNGNTNTSLSTEPQ